MLFATLLEHTEWLQESQQSLKTFCLLHISVLFDANTPFPHWQSARGRPASDGVGQWHGERWLHRSCLLAQLWAHQLGRPHLFHHRPGPADRHQHSFSRRGRKASHGWGFTTFKIHSPLPIKNRSVLLQGCYVTRIIKKTFGTFWLYYTTTSDYKTL